VLGVAWAFALLVSVSLAGVAVAVVLVPMAMVASVSGARAAGGVSAGRRGRNSRAGRSSPRSLFAVGAPVVLPLVALGGIAAEVAVASALTVVGALAVAPGRRPISTLFAVLAPSLAAASVVLARGQGADEAICLIAAICVYDMGSFVVGNSRTALGGPVGVLAGVASVAVVAVIAAAALTPPFSGDRPWLVFGVLAALAPAGVILSGWLTGGTRLPAVRRLDSLVLAGPGWVAAVSLVLHK
jgi:hypothetical protein